MAYQIVENRIGLPGIADVSVGVQLAPLGTTVRAFDETYGEGEFVYLAVPTSTAIPVGTLCVINPTAVTAGMFVDGNGISTIAKASQPFAGTKSNDVAQGQTALVAVNAVTSNASSVQFTWFQISGQAPVLKTAVAAPPSTATVGEVALSTTAGRIYFTLTSGQRQILGMRTANTATVTSTTSTVLCNFNRPIFSGVVA